MKALQPFCARIEIAGSIRRQRPECGDIDLVIEARDRAGLDGRVVKSCRLEASGPEYVRARMSDGVQIDLWFSHTPRVAEEQRWMFAAPDRKPDNFGCLLLSKTGSIAHNVALVERAKRIGRSWNPSWGVYQGSACIASATEADIYNALGLEYIEPTAREFSTEGERRRLVNRPQLQSA